MAWWYLVLSMAAVALKSPIFLQHVFSEHEPETPWHLQRSFMVVVTACIPTWKLRNTRFFLDYTHDNPAIIVYLAIMSQHLRHRVAIGWLELQKVSRDSFAVLYVVTASAPFPRQPGCFRPFFRRALALGHLAFGTGTGHRVGDGCGSKRVHEGRFAVHLRRI